MMKFLTTVFVVDPDESSRDSVCEIANHLGLPCEGYASGEDFLASHQESQTGCLVAEFKLSGIDGIALQEILASHGAMLPTIFLTRVADTQQTVKAMRNGAIAVLDKPLSRQGRMKALRKAAALGKEQHRVTEWQQKARARCAKLSGRERAILPFVQARMSNKKIANLLGVSKRNVKVARRNIFKKTKSKSLVELSRLAQDASVHMQHPSKIPLPLGRDANAQLNETTSRPREVASEAVREMLAYAFQTSIPGLVGELVHEVNQPLSVIVNASTIIECAVREEQSLNINEIRKWNGMISDSSKLATEIIRRFHAFAATRRIDRHDEPLDEIIRESIQLLRFAAQEHHVDVRLELEEVTVMVDRVQMQQVAMNLLKNAIESTSENPLNDRSVVVETFADLNGANMIVSDNGSGVSEAVAPDIFQPFLSSKKNGLGIGLSISKSIVESHDGNISYEPNHARGASFHVRLPLSRRDPRYTATDDFAGDFSKNDRSQE